MDPHSKELTYSFEFSRREHVRACVAIHRHSIHRRWARLLLKVFVGLVAVILIVSMAIDFRPEMIPSTLAVLAWLAFVTLLSVFSGYVQARQWEKLNPPGHRTLTVTFGEEAFRSASYVGSGDVRWVAVKQVVETSAFLLVYMTEKIAHYIPKRAIPDGDLPLVRGLLSSRVDSRYKNRT